MRHEVSVGAEGDEVRRIGGSAEAHPSVAVLDVIERHHLEDVGSVRAAPLVPADVAGVEDRGDASAVTPEDGAPEGGSHGIASHGFGPREA
jgi:hypothetical protein